MRLSSLQRHQLIWVVLALSYNAASALMIARGGAALAPTRPAAGVIFVLVVAGLVIAARLGPARVGKLTLPVVSLALIAAGVVPHGLAAIAGDLGAYASPLAWGAALAINVYGAGVFALSAVNAFSRRT